MPPRLDPGHLVELLEHALQLARRGSRCRCRRPGSRRRPGAVRTVSRTSPLSVYLIALDSRLRRMAVSAISSVSTVAGAPSALTTTSTGLPVGHRPGEPAQRGEQRGQADLRRVDDEPPGLGLGDVKQVVDQGEQRAGSVLISPTWYELLGAESAVRLGQQPGQPDDRVQRGAQLVADIGPEPVLGLRRRPQLLGLLVQLRGTARPRRGWSARVPPTARCRGPSPRGWSPAARR